MLDLAKSFLLILVYLVMFISLGSGVLHYCKEKFSFSLALLSGFFSYHLLFSVVALPCILTQQTLTTLMWIWLPILSILFAFSLWFSRDELFFGIPKTVLTSLNAHLHSPKKLILPSIAAIGVLFILYVSVCSYYVGWDTAFYVRTTLHAVENDSMYTLDAATGQLASSLSLRYALSPFYMSSAIFSRLFDLHPLLIQNLADGCICVLLAFAVIYRFGLLLSDNDHSKACLTVIFAATLHLSHASLFSTSDFLLLRSYEAKAYCANVVLPFVAYNLIVLWKMPDKKAHWVLFFLSVAASTAISMSSLFTVPVLVCSCSLIWLIKRNWYCIRNVILCMIPSMLFLAAYLLEVLRVIIIPII